MTPTYDISLKTTPALFMQRYTPPVLIDEIQYATELLPYIKMSADRYGRKGDFWLTGSQVFRLMKKRQRKSRGPRSGGRQSLGLSDAEIYGYESVPYTTDTERLMRRAAEVKERGLNEIYARIFKGSMPALHAAEIDWESYYRSYVETYLQRDIRDLSQVADEIAVL